jgi:hypothetical protein
LALSWIPGVVRLQRQPWDEIWCVVLTGFALTIGTLVTIPAEALRLALQPPMVAGPLFLAADFALQTKLNLAR